MTASHQRRWTRTITTPEGLPLNLEIAHAGMRLGAFLLDFLFQWLFIFLVVFVLAMISYSSTDQVSFPLMALVALIWFLVGNKTEKIRLARLSHRKSLTLSHHF